MSFVKTAEPVAELHARRRGHVSSPIALAAVAALLPLLLMLLVAFVGPRYLEAWTTQMPFATDFGAAGIVGVAIIFAALVVSYIMVAISDGATDAEVARQQAQALAVGYKSRGRLARVRAQLAAVPLEGVKSP